jgi:SNF2 family DNA or RNA helicase
VLFKRDESVPDELWHSLGRNIAPGAHRYLNQHGALVVPLQRFLASRPWLASALVTYDCGADLSAEIADLVNRSRLEQDQLIAALAGTIDPVDENDVEAMLHDSRFFRSLKPFQVRDLRRLLSLLNGANFSVPGAGKTCVAYACYEVSRLAARVDRFLVVAPLSAFDSWIEEARRSMSPVPKIHRLSDGHIPLDTEVLLTNYQRLTSRFPIVAGWVLGGQTMVLLDEAHRMKRGRQGEWGKACLDLSHLAARRDVLTGTPAPQHPRDFLALLEFLWPHQSTRIIPRANAASPSTRDMHNISERLRPLFVRTRKKELGLEEPVYMVHAVQMGPVQERIYSALRTKLRYAVVSSERERADLARLGEVVMYLLEAATNPALLASAIASGTPGTPAPWPLLPSPITATLADEILSYPSHEVPTKFQALATLIAQNAAEGRKTLVWSNFIGNLQRLGHELLAPHSPAIIYGAIPSSSEETGTVTREMELRRFREDDACKVLLANPAAMSEGVSLHETCHDAVYVDRTYNAGQYLQSLDRIHRLGLDAGIQTRITFLVSENSIDESVDQRVGEKASRLALMLNDPDLVAMALPDEESYGDWIDLDDVESLFGHLSS